MLCSFHIEDAEQMLTEDGSAFGSTLAGEKVIEAAKAYYALQNNQRPSIPCNEVLKRREDMGRGRLQLVRQEDGDICVAVVDSQGKMASIEFCTSVVGGGQSPKVLEALYTLAAAIIDDNKERPLPVDQRPANAQHKEFRAHFVSYTDDDKEVILPQYVDLNDPAIFEVATLLDVRGEKLEDHTSGPVVDSWRGQLTAFDHDACIAQVGGRWAGQVRFFGSALIFFSDEQIKTAQLEIKVSLTCSEHGFDDFDVTGHACVHRACVPHGIKMNEPFNVYHSGGKSGAIWHGDLVKSLTSFNV